ncbi:uncharacterized protein LOC131143465 isoform X2 [Malania oleifera]|uniref:uncharacterized protein LOC131143465 isoform X2 n=1 Tax=Malania oleifera TaxID=397392 RepID=UPI0025AE985B|nr:uncharacterized protein LOC131143465 isoform X2 [Malania oleifera]
MSFVTLPHSFFHFVYYSIDAINPRSYGLLASHPKKRRFPAITTSMARRSSKELLVVIGGGAAGVYGAIRAKTVAPNLNVVVIEKGKPLSKVKISGGGRCNVTNGHCVDKMMLAEHYPRGNKELRGSFFNMHGPVDTMSWFSDHGVELKTEDDGRVFPVSNSSSSIVDCLLFEAKQRGGQFVYLFYCRRAKLLQLHQEILLEISFSRLKRGYTLATQLGHSIVDPVPSLFTFKIKDSKLLELSGVTFLEVKAKLKLENAQRNIPQLTQVGPMLVTHWGLSGPVILRLSAWGARDLFNSGYKGTLFVDFAPHLHVEDMKSILIKRKNQCAKHKVLNSCPSEFGLVKRFWKYILDREGLGGDVSWISVSNNSLISVACLLKQCSFSVSGKGQFKDEFVTAGGVPLSEVLSLSHTHTHTHTNAYIHGHCCVCNCLCRNTKVSLNTMESKIQQHLFFAGEVINIDGVTGGFNFQNAWSGGYIAGTSIGSLALGATLKRDVS